MLLLLMMLLGHDDLCYLAIAIMFDAMIHAIDYFALDINSSFENKEYPKYTNTQINKHTAQR